MKTQLQFIKLTLLSSLLLVFSTAASAQSFSGGNGSSSTPYQISSLADLLALRAAVVGAGENGNPFSGDYFIQTCDIDLGVDPHNTGTGWIPIGILILEGESVSIDARFFSGFYNGQGYAIRNLYINDTQAQAGLFGFLKDAEISNLHFTDLNIANAQTGGALAAYIIGTDVLNCSSTGSINSQASSGGLIGSAMSESMISNCFSSCTVSVVNDYAGGLVGDLWDNSVISYSYASGTVSGLLKVGGLSGSNELNSTISNSYALGSVTGLAGGQKIGGLIGQCDSSIVINSFSKAAVSAPECTLVGGLIGHFFAGSTMTNSFWDNTTSGQLQSDGTGALGRNSNLMKTLYTFIKVGWDFKGESSYGSNEIWNIGNSRNDGYPYLSWQYPSDDGINPGPSTEPAVGDGSSESPYQVASLENLNWIAQHPSRWNKYYIQTADIDATSVAVWNNGEGWTPIGSENTYFTGSYDGQSYTISNLTINRSATNFMALFGVSQNAAFSNLNLSNVNVSGLHGTAAMVAYMELGNMDNCVSQGIVDGSGGLWVGGLVGYLGDDSAPVTVQNSSSSCTVTGVQSVGGLIGYNNGCSVEYCHATGNVTATGSYAGGLSGRNSGTRIYSNQGYAGLV